jgi:hypothetical protein
MDPRMSSESVSGHAAPASFAERGHQVTRLETFVDAAFAFAVTLLVISVDAIPDSLDGLLLALKGVPAFALSFVMIAMFWWLHARWSRRYGLDDLPSTLLSLLLVFLVLVYVYPLKLLFGLFFAWTTTGWFPSPIQISGYADVRLVFIIYGLGFAALSLCIAELYAHPLRQRLRLRLSVEEAGTTAGDVAAWRFAALVGGLSAGVAAVLPDDVPGWASGMPGFVYFLMNAIYWVANGARRRSMARALREAKA